MSSALRVLAIEDDLDSREMLVEALELRGATVLGLDSGEKAVAAAPGFSPNVMLIDMELPGMDGIAALTSLHQALGRAVPALALSGHATHGDRARSLAAGFAKHLIKPASMLDVHAALEALAAVEGTSGEESFRSLIGTLNASSACRFTSVLRFATDGTLTSVWTHDRADPGADPFPLRMPVEQSYCKLVRDTATPWTIEDAATDGRVADHPKKNELARYVGVPLVGSSGEIVGTLCSYDAQAQPVPDEVRRLHVVAAKRIAPLFERAFERPEQLVG